MQKALLIFVSFLGCAASQYNCNAGCSLDSSLMGPPVCDENGFTFVNACVAYCQVSVKGHLFVFFVVTRRCKQDVRMLTDLVFLKRALQSTPMDAVVKGTTKVAFLDLISLEAPK